VTFAVWAPLLMPVLAVPTARLLAGRVAPRLAVWLLAATAVTLALCSTAVLALFVGAGLLRLPFVAAAGDLSLPLMRRALPAPTPVTWVAAIYLVISVTLLVRAAQRRIIDLSGARRAVRAVAGGVTVTGEAYPDAYAVPGRPGHVVVTAGMLRALDGREREVLFAHERAHLACRHHRFSVAADLAATLHPALHGLRAPLLYNLERWADESAVRAVGDRRLVARAIGRAALARARAGRGPARTDVTPSATAGPVPRRVAALLADTPPSARSRLLPGVALALAGCLVVSGGGAFDTATDLHGQVEAMETHDGPGPGPGLTGACHQFTDRYTRLARPARVQ
jgi:hypothetical protein